MVESPISYLIYQSTLRELKNKSVNSLPFVSEFVDVKPFENPVPECIYYNFYFSFLIYFDNKRHRK